MTSLTATEARKILYRLLDEVSESHEPVQITGKRGNAVLVGEDDWRAVQETLHLLSIPGMRESIREGMATPIDELDERAWLVSWRLFFTEQAQRDAGEARRRWPEAEGAGAPRCSSPRTPIRPPALRKAGRRPVRCVLAADHHPVPARLSGLDDERVVKVLRMWTQYE